MMKLLKEKLKSKKGESLVEAMAAILIFTLASVLMFNMVQASNNINRTAKEKEQAIQEQLVTAEKGEGTAQEGSVVLTLKDSAGTKHKVTKRVDIYGADGELFSYFKK